MARPSARRVPLFRRFAWSSPGVREDRVLLTLGVALVVVVAGFGAFTCWDAGRREHRVRDAAAAARRVAIGGVDDTLYQDLVRMDEDEVALFQARGGPSTTGAARQASSTCEAPVGDPDADLRRAECDLAAVTRQLGRSAQVGRDVALISDELPVYLGLEASAEAYNQQGFPLGATYLREASDYLRAHMLVSAEDIRGFDLGHVTSDDSAATRLVLPPLVLGVGSLSLIVVAQVASTRYTRRIVNRGLLVAAVAVVSLAGWSAGAVLVSRHAIRAGARPHGATAADLAALHVDAIHVHSDDLLTLADRGTDCSASQTQTRTKQGGLLFHYLVTCEFEHDALKTLVQTVRDDLGRAVDDVPDAGTRTDLQHAALVVGGGAHPGGRWVADEMALPTLQNLEASTGNLPPRAFPRYNSGFLSELRLHYPNPAAGGGTAVTSDYRTFDGAVQAAVNQEWAAYHREADRAAGAFAGLSAGAIGLAAAACLAATAGIGTRVAEYWTT
jgi:hypothetical protein